MRRRRAISPSGTPDAKPPYVSSPGHAEGKAAGVRILVVEDDQAVRTLICAMLSQLGYEILEAGDGEDGLRIWEKHRDGIALVITDVVMPRMDGRDLARRIQEIHPGVLVIFMSGYSEAPIIEDIECMGAGFLPKPFTVVMLAATVRGALGKMPPGPPDGVNV